MKKLFTDDTFFFVMVLFTFAGEVIYSVIATFVLKNYLMANISLLFRVVLVLALYFSYKKHNKNTMKGLMGGLLTAQVLTGFSLVTAPFYFNGVNILYGLYLGLSLILFINHFIINSDHHSSPNAIKINQISVILLVIVNVLISINTIYYDPSTLIVVSNIADIFGFAGMSIVVVCVESRLDAYRLDREAAGWTDENGYPKNYVHESDKKTYETSIFKRDHNFTQ